jgi:hypothetical protein
MLNLVKRAREQSETLDNQEELLIKKIESLEKLTKEHEELKCSYDDLVQRYESISIEQTRATNSLLCVAQLENENTILKRTIEKLKLENVVLQENMICLIFS